MTRPDLYYAVHGSTYYLYNKASDEGLCISLRKEWGSITIDGHDINSKYIKTHKLFIYTVLLKIKNSAFI